MKKLLLNGIISLLSLYMPSIGNSAESPPDSIKIQSIQEAKTSAGDGLYMFNKPPLLPNVFLKLPPGSITAAGWLRNQLEFDAQGMVGRMAEISDYLQYENNGWVDRNGKKGWEEMPYWLRGYGDLGYVLKDEKIIAAARKWIDGIIATQREDGYFGPERLKTAEKGLPDLWPHMLVLDALHSFYEYSGDERVISFMIKFFRWQNSIPIESFKAGWGGVRQADAMAVIYWLYNKTGESWLLDLSKKIHENSMDYTTGIPTWHNVNLAQGIREPAEYWQQSKDEKFLNATENSYQKIMGTWGQFPGGGFSGDENIREDYFDPRQGFETCGFAEFMRTFEMMTCISGNPIWADRCEEIAVNSFPAAMSPDHTGLHYITCANCIQLDNQGKIGKQFSNGDYPMLQYKHGVHDYRCCTHNYGMAWPFYAENLWLATADKGLCASLYAASEVKANVGGGVEIKITEETNYPFTDQVQFHIATAKAVKFPLYLRIPQWCTAASLSINDKPAAISSTPSSYIIIDREWRDKDIITLHLPMRVSIRTWEKNRNSVSVNYGPLTFSLYIQEEWKRNGGTDAWPYYDVLPASPWNYGLEIDPKNPAQSIEVIHKNGAPAANPFTREGTSIELRAKARKITAWQADQDQVVGLLPRSPVKTNEALETVTLVPMGAARLRITAFPTVYSAEKPLPSSALYKPEWDSLKNHPDPKWFDDAKFGIYFHWGIYSVPAYSNEWYSRNMYVKDSDPNKHHVQNFGSLEKFGYKDFIPMFTAEKFNADEWAELFEKAGAKFAGPVAEHADGFAMWDSKLTKWNAAQMGPKQDIVGKMRDAVRKRGMKFITTFHHQWLWGWYPADDPKADVTNPDYAGLYGPVHSKSAFDFENPDPKPSEEFSQVWLDKIKEVIDAYQPDLLWFDSRMNIIDEKYRKEFIRYYYNKGLEWNKEIGITYKNNDLPKGAGIVDLERGRMSSLKEFKWLNDDSIDWNSWCYVQNAKIKTTKRLVDELVDIVSKNGNLLLNIPPKPNGEIPQEVKDRLLEMGEWLKINGEAIYGTRPWKIYGEGPTEVKEGHFGEEKIPDFTAQDIRFTTKDHYLYAFAMGWPESGTVTIKSLGKDKEPSVIENITLLGSKEKLHWRHDKSRLFIDVPKKKPCGHAYAFKMKFKAK